MATPNVSGFGAAIYRLFLVNIEAYSLKLKYINTSGTKIRYIA